MVTGQQFVGWAPTGIKDTGGVNGQPAHQGNAGKHPVERDTALPSSWVCQAVGVVSTDRHAPARLIRSIARPGMSSGDISGAPRR